LCVDLDQSDLAHCSEFDRSSFREWRA
jgi:hypothetical protein